MLKNLVYALPLALVLLYCDNKEKETLKNQVDSLKRELETSQEMAQTLNEVGTLMDSIDANRQLLRVNMVEGTTYDDYSSRMKDLNSFVKETQDKIAELEKSLRSSKANANVFANTIKKLKVDLDTKTQEIAMLQEQVENYRSQNENLTNTVKLQEEELADKEIQIESKQQELAVIEGRVQDLMIQSKMSEADAYFTTAKAVEETANRTKLAPRKKKETLKQAIELYKKSLSLGKNEAQAKIDELEKRL
jgi:chromosome segregation ATPase